MSAINLLTPVLNGGIQNVNFVNGRILTAADMSAERAANLRRQRLMGTCVGTGVATGLEVTISGSSAQPQQVLHVTAGLAINLNGDLLQLPNDIDLALTAPPQTATGNSGLFMACQPPQTQLTNPGIYILTVMPASGYQGEVPVTQPNTSGVAAQCTSQYATAGVQFRLAQITLASTGTGLQQTLYALANQIQSQLNGNASAATIAPLLSQMRNGLAHVCFGTEALANYAADPFAGLPQASFLESYGLIDDLRNGGLISDCEVPLAIAYWTLQGIQFADMWSVRRPVLASTSSQDWPIFSGRRRALEGLAIFLQFQDQVASLSATFNEDLFKTISAVNYFYFLPSAGFIPINNANPSQGFDYLEFFNNRTYNNPVFIEGARLNSIIQAAFLCPPIDLSTQELMWVYQVRENQETSNENNGNEPPLYMLFTSGRIDFQGKSRYDLNYFNYANYV